MPVTLIKKGVPIVIDKSMAKMPPEAKRSGNEPWPWPRVKAHYFAVNLDPERTTPYTIKQMSADLKMPWGTVRNEAAKKNERGENWNAELRRLSLEKSEIAVEGAKQQAAIDEAEIRTRQVTVSRLAIAKAVNKLQNIDPEKDLTVTQAIDLLRLGMVEERRAAGLPDVFQDVPPVETLHGEYESPLVKMARMRATIDAGEKLMELVVSKLRVHAKSPREI